MADQNQAQAPNMPQPAAPVQIAPVAAAANPNQINVPTNINRPARPLGARPQAAAGGGP